MLVASQLLNGMDCIFQHCPAVSCLFISSPQRLSVSEEYAHQKEFAELTLARP